MESSAATPPRQAAAGSDWMNDGESIAATFVRARRTADALGAFPGQSPPDLAAAYGVQDRAIAGWPDAVTGWKVGYIAADRRDASGDERLLGPIFRRQVQAQVENATFPVFVGGFGAIEAEFVLRLHADAPADVFTWSTADAATLPASLHIGVEIASSPLATINQLGPAVVVCDFGNNNGLVLGPQIHDWQRIPEDALAIRTWIDGECVGTGGASRLPGGLLAAYAFALSRSARRGRPLRNGDLIATGNATGIHDIRPGQAAVVDFGEHGRIAGRAVAALPLAQEDARG